MDVTLQTLIDAAQNAADGTKPADAVAALLADNPGADVAGLQGEALTRFDELSTDVADDETLAAVEALAEVVDGTRTEQARLDQNAAAQAERLAELNRRVRPDMTSETDDGAGESIDVADATGAEAGAVDAGAGTDSSPVEQGAEVGADTGAEAVAASAARPRPRVDLAKIPRRVTPAAVRKLPAITAAADVDGFASGQRLNDLTQAAQAAASKFAAFPTSRVPGTTLRSRFASITLPFPAELIADGSNDMAAIEHAADHKRLPKSLLASGGWCAPSETLYDLGPTLADMNVGMIDVPEVQAHRGGLRYTEGPDYTTVWSGSGFIQTESQAAAGSGFTSPTGATISGTTKPFYRVPCPSFSEDRAEAIGLGIVAGILANDAYPEMTADIVTKSLIAHAHRVNMRTINRMVAVAGSAISIGLGASATSVLLNSIDIQMIDYRYLNRTPEDFPLEIVMPMWVKGVIRADIAVRYGLDRDDAFMIGDDRINAYFAQRYASVQWVMDWQDAFSGVSGGFGSATAIASWPDTVDVLMYAAGTYVRARGNVINLDAIYDSTNIAVNDFHRTFVEEKLLVIKRRWKSRLLRIPLAANGTVGAAQILDSDGKIVPPA